MGIPTWLLVHSVTVRAYRGWDTYAQPEVVRCFIGEKLAQGGPTGTDRVGLCTIIAAPGVDCPAGSKITLPDGRDGYAEAVANHDSGGLGSGAVPDHIELAVRVATSYGPPFGEVVYLVHSTISRDASGSARHTTTSTAVAGCAVRQVSATENESGVLTTTVEVVVPPGTVVSDQDRMRVRGLLYQVQGVPEVVDDSMTDTAPGIKVTGRRVLNQ